MSGQLMIRSDNCSTQYKSRFVLHNLLSIAKQYGIRINWFGCKVPLRHANSGLNMQRRWLVTCSNFLLLTVVEFNLIKQEDTANERRKGREEFEIKGCQAAYIISLFPDGNIAKKNSPK